MSSHSLDEGNIGKNLANLRLDAAAVADGVQTDGSDGTRSVRSDVHRHRHHHKHKHVQGTEALDPDSGIVQNQDRVLNQAILQHAIKKDMKRKRNDSNASGTAAAVLHNHRQQQQQEENVEGPTLVGAQTGAASGEMSATAAIMLKLYGDKNQLAHEVHEAREVHEVKSAASNVRLPEVKKIKKPLPEKETEKVRTQVAAADEQFSNFSDFENENVRVILKWRDPQLQPYQGTGAAIKSHDIYSTLRAIKSELITPERENKEDLLYLDYDAKKKDWFVPDLYLPPGIYRLKFLINGMLLHSNFLPTATDAAGTIVNWFEVLPGYETIEPYRDESMIGQDDESIDSQPYKSTTDVTDYAGISRSSSVVSKHSKSNLRLPNLHITSLNKESSASVNEANETNEGNDIQLLPEPKYEYSTEIPELFQFDDVNTRKTNDIKEVRKESKLETLYPNGKFDFTLARVVNSNQDALFASIQKIGKMTTEEAEEYFLTKFKVSDLPIYLNSTYLNKNFSGEVNHIIPHVNLRHLLTTSIKEDIICVGCTTRYAGKFITQVIYAPCSYDKQ
ncbi:Sip1p KNAG_0C03230 [Huiozyma naganishii CBS 8797]|uniref:Association with the SNF1 complex (ASC) domain-containing protein n=1 Tax=Huiozyma naganishii (strain ATCC MYA-139 / BCRC 22969 / CBS 8797 / KCTC 17520 / NBRC 10181 / NCYC 3082 / Yp74L-3) TaxID=1071383 RepID=J7RWP1_HUIN7|nr:hypothetical protein KNAG_0C03230 [Kazachstania naganishii CBS 8797]CCK69432.1 hypothetical protein KNAG_0C03230 [Kazachstania naganishii CBS 8797]